MGGEGENVPDFFDNPVTNATAWVEAGRPPKAELAPVYARNVVRVGIGPVGQLMLTPQHVDLVVVDGTESPLGDPVDEWIDGDRAINPAAAPADGRIDLQLAHDVDGELLEKIRAAIDAATPGNGREEPRGEDWVRHLRRHDASLRAWEALCAETSTTGATSLHKDSGSRDFSILRLADGRIVHTRTGAWWMTCVSPIRVEGERVTYFGEIHGKVHEYSCTVPVKVGLVSDPAYAECLERARVRIADAIAAADAAPLVPELKPRQSRDQALKALSFPKELELKWHRPSRSSRGWDEGYRAQKEMAEALGYAMVGREYVSGSGSSKSSKWALAGGCSVASLVPEAVRIDEVRGEIRVPKAKVGIVIGSGGARIRKIEQLTGRRWRVIGE